MKQESSRRSEADMSGASSAGSPTAGLTGLRSRPEVAAVSGKNDTMKDLKTMEEHVQDLEQIIQKIRPAQQAALTTQRANATSPPASEGSLLPNSGATLGDECHSGFYHMSPYAGVLVRHTSPSRQTSPQ
eukprot:CAMPEP_0178417616 /NCGR_PEP_ID=MMETSP0689_2-20121128/24663_1 /TAXON_ID=160604 /ORGANISM="Amphidinium massartii, Strain CS-259" /LENGTH=129 /DNA_ID=CAMNT_0020038981 /DNA_START=243 /DNA_END=632 /DNA_ORIENTATION=+